MSKRCNWAAMSGEAITAKIICLLAAFAIANYGAFAGYLILLLPEIWFVTGGI